LGITALLLLLLLLRGKGKKLTTLQHLMNDGNGMFAKVRELGGGGGGKKMKGGLLFVGAYHYGLSTARSDIMTKQLIIYTFPPSSLLPSSSGDLCE